MSTKKEARKDKLPILGWYKWRRPFSKLLLITPITRIDNISVTTIVAVACIYKVFSTTSAVIFVIYWVQLLVLSQLFYFIYYSSIVSILLAFWLIGAVSLLTLKHKTAWKSSICIYQQNYKRLTTLAKSFDIRSLNLSTWLIRLLSFSVAWRLEDLQRLMLMMQIPLTARPTKMMWYERVITFNHI